MAQRVLPAAQSEAGACSRACTRPLRHSPHNTAATIIAQSVTRAAVCLQEFKGYVFKIMGGQDKQGFPMKQGVLTNDRVRLLMAPGDKCFRGYGRRKGERRRKSVRGCIISQDISVLNLLIVKQGAPRRNQYHDVGDGTCALVGLTWLCSVHAG